MQTSRKPVFLTKVSVLQTAFHNQNFQNNQKSTLINPGWFAKIIEQTQIECEGV